MFSFFLTFVFLLAFVVFSHDWIIKQQVLIRDLIIILFVMVIVAVNILYLSWGNMNLEMLRNSLHDLFQACLGAFFLLAFMFLFPSGFGFSMGLLLFLLLLAGIPLVSMLLGKALRQKVGAGLLVYSVMDGALLFKVSGRLHWILILIIVLASIMGFWFGYSRAGRRKFHWTWYGGPGTEHWTKGQVVREFLTSVMAGVQGPRGGEGKGGFGSRASGGGGSKGEW